jgi:predicted PurR-regulated permease PerM
MNKFDKLPFYIRASLFLLGLYLFITMLSIGQDIILPLIYGAIIAISISPLVKMMVKRRINRTVSIAGVLTIASLLVITLFVLLSSQVTLFKDAFPRLSMKFQDLVNQTVNWISINFNIRSENINAWIANIYSEILKNSNAAIGTTLTTIGGVFSTAVLTPVYSFMILYYQSHLVAFAHSLFGSDNDDKVTEILTETKSIIQNYLGGLFIEFAIISVLNSIGLFILGMEYAILLGILGALLNVIPYIGGVVAVVLYMIIALITKEPIYVVYVVLLYTIIQLIDNNYIVPKVIGSKVRLNALVSIIVVIAGAALWGVPGMFLSIPLTAILKLIFDRIDSLKHWGILLGDVKQVVKRQRKVKGLDA